MGIKTNIVIDQGTDYSETFELLNPDGEEYEATGYTAYATLRKFYESNTGVDFSTILVDGGLTLQMNASTTANLDPGRYVYDVLIVDTSNAVSKPIEGVATVKPSATRL